MYHHSGMYSLLLRASDSLILSLFFVIEQMIFISERDQYYRRLFFFCGFIVAGAPEIDFCCYF